MERAFNGRTAVVLGKGDVRSCLWKKEVITPKLVRASRAGLWKVLGGFFVSGSRATSVEKKKTREGERVLGKRLQRRALKRGAVQMMENQMEEMEVATAREGVEEESKQHLRFRAISNLAEKKNPGAVQGEKSTTGAGTSHVQKEKTSQRKRKLLSLAFEEDVNRGGGLARRLTRDNFINLMPRGWGHARGRTARAFCKSEPTSSPKPLSGVPQSSAKRNGALGGSGLFTGTMGRGRSPRYMFPHRKENYRTHVIF